MISLSQSNSASSKPRKVNLPNHRLRSAASTLLNLHPAHSSPGSPPPPETPPVKIICVSDTHNTQPALPPGDILIHAGDLTENGSFDEIQAQLTWLASQAHSQKVIVAGNHDVLLDEHFLEKYPERRYSKSEGTTRDLEWGGIRYLNDEVVRLDISTRSSSCPADDTGNNPNNFKETRQLTIYGNPYTPQYGISAFQYPCHMGSKIWDNHIPPDTDIVIAHSTPRLHLDNSGTHRAGCPYLAREVTRVRPRVVVSGHIHASYGREDVVLDGARRGNEEVEFLRGGWGTVGVMGVRVLGARVGRLLGFGRKKKVTTFVNASVVGEGNVSKNEPVVVEI